MKLEKDQLSSNELKGICNDPIFQEAIYLASPYFYQELRQWLNSNGELSPDQHLKVKNTIIKYYSRMSTRCTPFGLFSGIGLGIFNKEITESNKKNNQKLSDSAKIRDTKLDMHFLVSLAKYLTDIPSYKNQLFYSPNNSIYRVGDNIRYVEYQYTNGKRDYIISSAPFSHELEHVMDFSQQGKTIGEIVKSLVNNEIKEEEAQVFINELIDNQVLISELEPNVSGEDFLEVILCVLNRIEAREEEDILISIKNKLDALDLNIGNPISQYLEIEKLIQSFHAKYEQKYLFQTDLYFKNTVELPVYWTKEIKKGISFLNKITQPYKDTHLNKFKKAFYERFETREMPLSYVLDTEIGIGYRQDISAKGIHSYLDDLVFPVLPDKQNLKIELTPIQKILNEKLQEALLDKKFTIELYDEDFKGFEENWDDLPNTMSFMAEIISENSYEKLYIGSGGGSSAANLLGRFCSEKSEVKGLTKKITEKEEDFHTDSLLAEIIHLPQARLGNVIRRPTLRSYEIPYLAQSILPPENQISINDLYISLRNDRIILRSKKLNKEIIPCLTNAHNYYTDTLPIYHFLSDLHSQNSRTELYFNWGGLNKIYKFLPRIEYNNVILSKAQWNIIDKDIDSLEVLIEDKEQVLSKLKIWRNKRNIPQWIQWVKYDNTLPINLENYDMVRIFIQTIRKEKSIIISEFLYNENDDYKHEFVFSIYKNMKL
ncbi:lantibiotic dehydratase family protein [Chryseobacterium paludis]|uniref:lantibiotic dehydratase family protein n=1 Tax=Chryseobacterium paludis TaxID=2956784 RepID=UPI0021C117F4|nr:lantibiotic dehydratase family protein [Chryseobacterium paludis]